MVDYAVQILYESGNEYTSVFVPTLGPVEDIYDFFCAELGTLGIMDDMIVAVRLLRMVDGVQEIVQESEF